MTEKDSKQAESGAAVALKYDEKRAPEVTATGQGDLAREIIALAREHGVPLYEHPELVEILARLDLGEEIPETLYRVIAEILAFAFYLQGKTPEDF
ncbi:EscU/YscU/HrcU family type III secretion system export apparatus switch protein [Marinobacteraceae bacterium S3BR75-40.1]